MGSAVEALPGIAARIAKANETFGRHGEQRELVIGTPLDCVAPQP